VYTPTSILKGTHPKVYAAWLERFPEAVKYTWVQLTGDFSTTVEKPAASELPIKDGVSMSSKPSTESLAKPHISPAPKPTRHKKPEQIAVLV